MRFKEYRVFSLQGMFALGVTLIAAATVIALVRMLSLELDRPLPVPAHALYRNPARTVDERVKDLMSYMTLEEKVGQMALVEKNSIGSLEDIKTYGLGAILSGAGAKPAQNTSEGWREMIVQFDSVSRSSRLGVPIFYGLDAIHGHSNVPGATIFPHAIGVGAANDPALTLRIADATRKELRATGVTWSYSPNLDLPQDMRWGRVYESFSDDPLRSASHGVAYVQGLMKDAHVVATAKHFIGGGAMQWNSSSNKDFKIDQGTTPSNDEALRRDWLTPFKAVVDAGVPSVMVGLNSYGDRKLSAERTLISDVLKGELGFKGFVVSDWYGVYEIPGSKYDATVTAINAGIDMVMLPFDYKTFIRQVMDAVEVGDITEARIDDAVYRILRAKFESGLFDTTVASGDLGVIGSSEHRALAREVVAHSAVLLKNNNRTLPLVTASHIKVAGSAAHNIGRQSGAWTVEWQGIDGNELAGATSILDGIRAAVPQNTTVEYIEAGGGGSATRADIGIAIVGEAPYAEGWGDSSLPRLTEEDMQTIAELRDSSDTLVVVLVTGRPLLIESTLEVADAFVVVWLPGSEGAGVADVLFGKAPFRGTLPLPWPRTIDQVPVALDGTTADGSSLLFPRNFGLR